MYITRVLGDSVNRSYGLLWTLFIVVSIIGQMRAFEKAGYNWWYAIVPFLSAYKLQQIAFGKDKGWTFVIFLVPVLGWLFAVYSILKFFKAYNISTILAIVGLFFIPLAMIYIGFSDSVEYAGAQEMW